MKIKSFALLALLGFIFILLFANSILRNRQAEKLQSQVVQTQTHYKNITSQELNTILQNKDFFLVNVHIPYEGEIEKTDVNISYNEIERNLDKLPSDKNAKIVLYCKSGRMSEIAAEKLTSLGYKNVYNLIAGMHDWQSKGYRLVDYETTLEE